MIKIAFYHQEVYEYCYHKQTMHPQKNANMVHSSSHACCQISPKKCTYLTSFWQNIGFCNQNYCSITSCVLLFTLDEDVHAAYICSGRLYFKRMTGDLITHIHGDILMNYCGGEVTGCSGSLVCSDKFYQQRAELMHPCPLYFCLFVNIQRLTLWSLVLQRQTPIDSIQTFVGLSNYLHAFSRHSFSADASFH